MSDTPIFELGKHVRLDGEIWLPVRFVDQSTLHEEPTTGDKFIDHEKFIELRNKEGVARFAMLDSNRVVAKRDKGPCRGIKPYFWKGVVSAKSDEASGSQGDSGGDSNIIISSGAGKVERLDGDNGSVESTQTDSGEGASGGERPDPQG